MIWTTSQRRALIAMLAVGLACVTARAVRNPVYLPMAQASTASASVPEPAPEELADRIDPNTADAETLAALPYLGEKRAKAIVDYREKFVAGHPGGRAYASAGDLMRIKGIGPATVERISAYLAFPAAK
jgi:competence protein ComEA